jgi:transposase
MRPYSLDLRERVVRAVQEGSDPETVASTFRVHESTVYRWLQRQANGSLAARSKPGRPRCLTPEEEASFTNKVEADNDRTLTEYAAWLARETGKRLSLASVSRELVRLGFTRKRKASSPANATN